MKPTPTHRQTKTKPFAVFVFTLALVCQLFMPFTQSLAAFVTDGQNDSGQSIVFCTPLGLTTVSLNANTDSLPPLNAIPKACEFCQICELSTHSVGISKASFTYSFTAPIPFILRPEHFTAPLKQNASSRQFPARAPPRLT